MLSELGPNLDIMDFGYNVDFFERSPKVRYNEVLLYSLLRYGWTL